LEDLIQEACAAQVHTHVKALEAAQELTGLGEGGFTHHQVIELIQIELQPTLERSEGAGMDPQRLADKGPAGAADHTSVGHVKMDRTATRHSSGAAHASRELRAQPQSIECPKL
jgi:hypothetical protein